MLQFAESLLRDAEASPTKRWLLDRILSRVIPFNKPHGLQITNVTETECRVHLPYHRRNYNHVRGLHACALATVAEYCSGLLLLRHLGLAKYRIIMKQLSVEYHYQGKADATAVFSLPTSVLNEEIIAPLEEAGVTEFVAQVRVTDSHDNHLCTAAITWQIKAWKAVKTRT